MATIIYDNETTFDALKDRTIAIMGYGSQGHGSRPEPPRLRA